MEHYRFEKGAEYAYICNYCNKATLTEQQMKMHLKKHLEKQNQAPPFVGAPAQDQFKATNNKELQSKQIELEELRLDLERKKVEKEISMIGQPPQPAISPFEQALSFVGKIKEMVKEELQSRQSIEAEVRKQVEALVQEEQESPTDKLGFKVLELLGKPEILNQLLKKQEQPQNSIQQAEVEAKLNATIKTPPQPAASAISQKQLRQFEKYKKAIQSGKITESEAWEGAKIAYPEQIKNVSREQFKAEFEKIKNSNQAAPAEKKQAQVANSVA